MTEDFIGLDGSSRKGPRESIIILLSGELSASDQHLCCASWIGCTSWALDMMHRPSTPTRSNHSRKGAKRSSHSGCRVRPAVPSTINDQLSTLLQEVTSSCPTLCRGILRFSCCYVRRRCTSGGENSTGSPGTVEWP